MASATLLNPLQTGNLIRKMEMQGLSLVGWKREREKGDQAGEVGDNHQVHSKPICCLVNRRILLECHVRGTGLTSPQSQPIRPAIQAGASRGDAVRGPRLGLLNRGIKAGMEGWAPSLCALVSPKTNASSCPMEAAWRWSARRNRWCRGLPLGDTCTLQKEESRSTHPHVWFLDDEHLGLLLLQSIVTHNYVVCDILWSDLLKMWLPV